MAWESTVEKKLVSEKKNLVSEKKSVLVGLGGDLPDCNWGEHWRHARELAVEVAGIGSVLDRRHERRRDAFVVDIVPVDSSEEGMAHDLLSVSRSATQSKLWLTREQLLQN